MKYYARASVLQPAYMNKFSCVGGNCEDNCCQGRIDVDKETYIALKSLPDSPLKRLYFESVSPEKNGNSFQYASINGDPRQKCPFLNESGLCQIQAELGEDCLSCACYSVPRHVNRIGGIFERSLRLFCPEASRVVLFNDGIMEFDSFLTDQSMKTHIFSNISGKQARGIQPGWFEIRSTIIDILQDRRFDIGHRLMLAGLAAEELDKMNASGATQADVQAFLAGMEKDFLEKGSADEIASIRSSDNAAFARLLALSKHLFMSYSLNDEGYLGYLEKLMMYYGHDDAVSGQKLVLLYHEANERFDDYIKDKQYILENWLVNMVFTRSFPLRNQKSLLAEFAKLEFYYFLMKMMLAGIAAAGGAMDDAILVDFVHRYAKLVEMEPRFEAAVDDAISKNGLANMEALLVMSLH